VRLLRSGRSGSGLPREVAARVDDRALASAEATDGTWLVGTRAALVLVGDDVVRIPWEQVEGADWDREESRLRFAEIGEYGVPRPSYSFTLPDAEPRDLLELVRERVTASIVLQRGHLVAGKRGFKVVGRRSPAGGPISWMFEYDEEVDPADPTVVEAADALLRRAREDVGE
jgi:hypothetical protein